MFMSYSLFKSVNIARHHQTIHCINNICNLFTRLKSLDTPKGAEYDRLLSVLLKRCFGGFVASSSILFKMIIPSSIFPARWKKALIVPVFKSSDKICVSNYRPISKLCEENFDCTSYYSKKF